MRNCLVLGSGRSGTSMVAGSLLAAGYYMGGDLMPPTPSNPKGYFESYSIEAINEDLLELAEAEQARRPLEKFWGRHERMKRSLAKRGYLKTHVGRPTRKQRWLSILPVNAPVPCPAAIAARISDQTRQQPFCFKDPRFCYTLPAWRPYLPNTVFVCVFRHPAVTTASILRNCQEEPYLSGLKVTFGAAMQAWIVMYRHILNVHRHQGEWLFVHANQLFEATGMERLEQFVDARLDRHFPDAKLQHPAAEQAVPWASRRIYARLCKLAGYKDDGRHARGTRS